MIKHPLCQVLLGFAHENMLDIFCHLWQIENIEKKGGIRHEGEKIYLFRNRKGGELIIIKITNKNLVGIDIGKSEHAVAMTEENKTVKTFMVKNTPSGRTEFVKRLNTAGPCSIALEQVGGWASPLDQQLLSAGHQLLTIHPLRMSRARELYGQPHKTDEKDARLLLWLIQQLKQGFIPKPETKSFQLVIPCSKSLQRLKQLSRHYHILSWSKTQTLNQLTGLLLCYLPTLKTVFKLFDSWSCLSILSHTPCPSEWAKIHGQTLKAWFRHDSQKSINYQRVQRIKKYAWSGDWEALLPEVAFQIKHLAKRLLLLKKQKESTNFRIAAIIDKLPEGQALMTLPGCGLILASTILAELSPIERFKSHNQIAMYVGLTKVRWESGGRKSSKKVKLVNRRAKWAFRQLLHLNHHYFSVSQTYVKKQLRKGKSSRQARLALGRQLVKVVTAIIKTKKPFDPNYC